MVSITSDMIKHYYTDLQTNKKGYMCKNFNRVRIVYFEAISVLPTLALFGKISLMPLRKLTKMTKLPLVVHVKPLNRNFAAEIEPQGKRYTW